MGCNCGGSSAPTSYSGDRQVEPSPTRGRSDAVRYASSVIERTQADQGPAAPGYYADPGRHAE